MHDIPFVDAHVHLWDVDRLRYPWLTPPFADDGPNGSVEAIASTYLPQDYRAETSRWNVAGYVHIDAGADPRDAMAETKWLAGLSDRPDGIVAFARLDDPQVDTALAGHAATARVRGIRHIVNWHPDRRRSYTPRDVTGDEAWQRGFALLARHGFSFDLQCYPGQMPGLVELFARHEDIPVIIDHLGMPVPDDPDGWTTWRDGLRMMAALPQVCIKLSGVGFIDRKWTVETVRPYVSEAIALFGTDRVCVASDLPTDRLFGSLDSTLGAYAEMLADCSHTEKHALWGGNADRFYRLGLLKGVTHG